jgi:ATP-dependent RNA helicase DDX54/DBP10
MSSPAPSNGGFDIADALFGGEDETFSQAGGNGPGRDISCDIHVMGEESDDEDIIAEQQSAANRKASNLKGHTVKKGGGAQALGLNANLLKATTRKGYSVPTPIQRKTIALLLNDKDS